MTVILSVICMAFFTYIESYCENIPSNSNNPETTQSKCLETYKNQIDRDNILKTILFCLNIIFCFEALIKIIAMGFLLDKQSYLRRIQNILDFFVTINSFIEYFFPTVLKGIRAFRLIRVLKQFAQIGPIKKLIDSILVSLPTLINVFLFLAFTLIILATLGIQLFSGTFYNRCRENPYPYFDFYHSSVKFRANPITNFICAENSHYYKEATCPAGTHCVNLFNIPAHFNFTNKNYSNLLEIYVQGNSSFSAIEDFEIEFFEFLSELNLAKEELEKIKISKSFIDVNDEILFLKENKNLKYGFLNFDNIYNAAVNVFVLFNYENWSEAVSVIINANSIIITIIIIIKPAI